MFVSYLTHNFLADVGLGHGPVDLQKLLPEVQVLAAGLGRLAVVEELDVHVAAVAFGGRDGIVVLDELDAAELIPEEHVERLHRDVLRDAPNVQPAVVRGLVDHDAIAAQQGVMEHLNGPLGVFLREVLHEAEGAVPTAEVQQQAHLVDQAGLLEDGKDRVLEHQRVQPAHEHLRVLEHALDWRGRDDPLPV